MDVCARKERPPSSVNNEKRDRPSVQKALLRLSFTARPPAFCPSIPAVRTLYYSQLRSYSPPLPSMLAALMREPIEVKIMRHGRLLPEGNLY